MPSQALARIFTQGQTMEWQKACVQVTTSSSSGRNSAEIWEQAAARLPRRTLGGGGPELRPESQVESASNNLFLICQCTMGKLHDLFFSSSKENIL